MAIRQAKILGGLEQIAPHLTGQDKKFIELCISTGNIEVAAQQCGITDARPWLRVSRLRLKYLKPSDGRTSLFHPKNTLRERQLKRAVDKLYGKLETISDPKVLLKAIDTITKMGDRSAEGGGATVASAPRIAANFVTAPAVCPACGYNLAADGADMITALKNGGKFRESSPDGEDE
jgi:hypothetical protein